MNEWVIDWQRTWMPFLVLWFRFASLKHISGCVAVVSLSIRTLIRRKYSLSMNSIVWHFRWDKIPLSTHAIRASVPQQSTTHFWLSHRRGRGRLNVVTLADAVFWVTDRKACMLFSISGRSCENFLTRYSGPTSVYICAHFETNWVSLEETIWLGICWQWSWVEVGDLVL